MAFAPARGMKREAAYPRYKSPSMKVKKSNFEIRLLVPSAVAGAVIGTGGHNIQRIRQENGSAKIKIPDCPGPERVIYIETNDEDSGINILTQIVSAFEGSPNRKDTGSDGVEVRFLFHHALAGCIIGTGGDRIKEIRKTTSSQIKIYGTCCPGSTDRIAAISGTVEQVIDSIQHILRILSEQKHFDVVSNYDPLNFDPTLANEYGGFEDDSRGGGSGRGKMRSHRRDQYPQGANDGRFSSNNRGGSRPNRGGGTRNLGGNAQCYGNAGGPGQGGFWEQGDFEEKGKETSQVTIPNEYAGAIIGHMGSNINRVRCESGAAIKIDESLPGSDERIITITGTPGAIKKAQYLMQQNVREFGGLLRR